MSDWVIALILFPSAAALLLLTSRAVGWLAGDDPNGGKASDGYGDQDWRGY